MKHSAMFHNPAPRNVRLAFVIKTEQFVIMTYTHCYWQVISEEQHLPHHRV